ncbi:hypothetical protein Hypma_001928 [Hypsizygus marmoreus]|uniref:Deoxyribonuclease NucA/NucB domain-containing protein n=1 Tax=Hypsizygus marmoreus TaxID=39966 RepID=A0A369J7E4_HYPMA|nr:hypothetical protein Hypma_001928 [Hypsizygus marmoreus]
MFKFILSAISVLPLLFPLGGAVTFNLNTNAYPEVTDHHCIASTTERQRRHAVGCDGVTNCQSASTGRSCDEIPYASTFDGGLGCFARDWTNSGRSINSLYIYGTHRCVNAGQNSAHGSALGTFYSQNNIQNFQEFNVAIPIPTGGCPNPNSVWCVRFLNAVRSGGSAAAIRAICSAATSQQSYQKVLSSAYSTNPRCPSRNYRRDESSIDANNTADALAKDIDADMTLHDITPDMVQIATLENGMQILPMFGGAHKLDDDVWVHEDSSDKGAISKVVRVASMKEMAKELDELDKRQNC